MLPRQGAIRSLLGMDSRCGKAGGERKLRGMRGSIAEVSHMRDIHFSSPSMGTCVC